MVNKTLFRTLILFNLLTALTLCWIEYTGLGVLSVVPAESFGFSEAAVKWMILGAAVISVLIYAAMFFLLSAVRYLFLLLAAWWAVGPFVGFIYAFPLEGGLMSKQAILPPLEFAVVNLHAAVLGIIVTLSFTSQVFHAGGR